MMRRTVLDRAGLHQTFMGAEESWHGPLANPHLDFDGDGVHENLGDQSQTAILTSFWTCGAEIWTAADLTRFGISLFEGGLLSPGANLPSELLIALSHWGTWPRHEPAG